MLSICNRSLLSTLVWVLWWSVSHLHHSSPSATCTQPCPPTSPLLPCTLLHLIAFIFSCLVLPVFIWAWVVCVGAHYPCSLGFIVHALWHLSSTGYIVSEWKKKKHYLAFILVHSWGSNALIVSKWIVITYLDPQFVPICPCLHLLMLFLLQLPLCICTPSCWPLVCVCPPYVCLFCLWHLTCKSNISIF